MRRHSAFPLSLTSPGGAGTLLPFLHLLDRLQVGSEWTGAAAPLVSLLIFLALATMANVVASRAESDAVTHHPSGGIRREGM